MASFLSGTGVCGSRDASRGPGSNDCGPGRLSVAGNDAREDAVGRVAGGALREGRFAEAGVPRAGPRYSLFRSSPRAATRRARTAPRPARRPPGTRPARHGDRVAPAAQDLGVGRRDPARALAALDVQPAARPRRGDGALQARRVRGGRAGDRRDAAGRVAAAWRGGAGFFWLRLARLGGHRGEEGPRVEEPEGRAQLRPGDVRRRRAVPTTCARTTRGETPRCRTLMRLKRPCR